MSILISFAGGIALGIFFYAGLWLTIRALCFSRHPILLTLSSFWTRMLIALGGFFLFMHGQWENAAAWLAGFILGRIIVSILLPRAERERPCT